MIRRVGGVASALAMALAIAACGGAPRIEPRAVSTSGDEDVVSLGDASVAVVPRRSGGHTWMSLWIDAGSRDAEPAALATVAAWAVASAHGIEARVVPDGTELHVGCESARIDACVDALVGALATREIDERALAAATERLRASRRGARRDPARIADRLAVLALTGDSPGLDPLGEGADDPRITKAAVEELLAAHWGPSRALFVIVGDADEARARAALADALAGAPPARVARAERALTPEVGARVEVGDEALASVAIALPDVQRALAIAELATTELERGSASVFPLRGAEVVLLRGRDVDEVAAAAAYARAVAGQPTDVLAEDDPRSLARRVGARWVARGARADEGGLGIGAVVAGGRGDVDAEDPDARVREEARARLEALARESEARARGEGITIDASAERVSLRDPHGTSVEVRRTPVGRVAIAVAIEGGVRDEPARVQGRSALLARLLARCADARGGEAWVDGRSIGAVVEVAPARVLEAVARVTRCVRRLPASPALVEEERARALATLGRDALHLSRAALALAPGAPALVAPQGTHASLAAIDGPSLTRAWRAMATRGRVRLAIVGEVEPERVGRAAILGLAELPPPSERASRAPVTSVATDEIVAVASEDEHVEVTIAIRDPRARESGDVGAAAALHAIVAALDGPALRVVWARAGAGVEGAWLAMAVRGSEEVLAALPARLDAARARARAEIDAAIVRSADAEREAQARGLATAAAWARRLAGGEREPGAASSSADTARALLDAPPRYVVARPPAVEARGRRGPAR